MDRNTMKEKFYEHINKRPQKANSFQMSSTKYYKLMDDVKAAKSGTNKENRHYWLLKHYDVITVDTIEKLIVPQHVKHQVLYYVVLEEVFDILYETHVSIHHGGRDRMRNELQKRYKNITVQDIQIFLNLCERCMQKRTCEKKGIVEKPINFSHFKSRCQLDLIDFQSHADGEFNFIMVYQDYLTKFVVLRALKSEEAIEVAEQLLSIFLLFGAPSILESTNGREFVLDIIEELEKMWPELKIICGKLKSEGNQDIEKMLNAWMQQEQCNNWSKGLGFMQFMKNKALNSEIKKSPHQAMFGHPPNIGLASSSLPRDVIQDVNTEEDLEKVLQEQNKFQVVDIHENKTLQEDVFLKEEDIFLKEEDIFLKEEVSEHVDTCKICEAPIHFLNDDTDFCEHCSLQMKGSREEAEDNLEIEAKRIKIISNIKEEIGIFN